MAFYRIYQEVADTHTMTLRGRASDMGLAIKAGNALMAGRTLPAGTFPDAGVHGIVTGIPVWVRNKSGRGLAVMVTEHESLEQAYKQEAAIMAALGGGCVAA